MSKVFRRALKKGVGYVFFWKDRRYEVIDEILIYHYDSDSVYVKDLDF